MVYRDLWVNWLEKRLQQSDLNGGEFVLPDFNKYESMPLRVRILAPDPSGVPEGYSLVSVAPLSLTISINDTLDDATPLVMQSTWAADTTLNEFTGVLDLNTAAMNSYVGTTISGVLAWLQIDVTQTGGQTTQIYQRQIRILNSVTKPTSTVPDVAQTYYTAQQTDGLFLKPIGTPGQFFTVLSPSGNFARTFGVDDNGAAVDSLLPYP